MKRGVLRVGMDTFVPWAMKDKTGKLIGFEIDVATRLAADLDKVFKAVLGDESAVQEPPIMGGEDFGRISAAVPGVLHYDVLREDDRMRRLLDDLYASYGITTAQDGAAFPGAVAQLRSLAESGRMPIDVVAYPVYKACDEALVAEISGTWKDWGRFRLGGVKLIADGSIQGYTAYLSEPYFRRPVNATAESAECESPAGIARATGSSVGTVRWHLKNVQSKLGVHSQAELASRVCRLLWSA